MILHPEFNDAFLEHLHLQALQAFMAKQLKSGEMTKKQAPRHPGISPNGNGIFGEGEIRVVSFWGRAIPSR